MENNMWIFRLGSAIMGRIQAARVGLGSLTVRPWGATGPHGNLVVAPLETDGALGHWPPTCLPQTYQ